MPATSDAEESVALREAARATRRIFVAWWAITLLSAAALIIGLATRGVSFFYAFQGPADASTVEVKFLVFTIAWLILGGALWLTRFTALLRQHGVFLVVLGLLSLSYLNVVRGPHKVEHLDFSNYFNAAERMRASLPLDDDPRHLYLYPPLLATLLEPLVPFGLGPASWLFRFGNYAAVLIFAVFLYLSLQRMGAGRHLAAVLVFAALAANVPIGDTLYAQQINLHVANLVLAGFLLLPAQPLLSAICFGLGAHLKVFPLVLAFAFVLTRQWRWCAWFALTIGLVIAATASINSPAYYWEFIEKSSTLREVGIRNVSVNSLVYNTARLAGLPLGSFEQPIGLALRVALGCLTLWWGSGIMRSGGLARAGHIDQRVTASSIAVLSIVMLVISPSIWVHHLVLAIFPSLAILLVLSSAADVAIFGVAYFLVFLVPVHEIYPFSYLRLVGLVTFAALLPRVLDSAESGRTPLLARLEKRFMTALCA